MSFLDYVEIGKKIVAEPDPQLLLASRLLTIGKVEQSVAVQVFALISECIPCLLELFYRIS